MLATHSMEKVVKNDKFVARNLKLSFMKILQQKIKICSLKIFAKKLPKPHHIFDQVHITSSVATHWTDVGSNTQNTS